MSPWAAKNVSNKEAILSHLEGLKSQYPSLKKDLEKVIKILQKQTSAYQTMSDQTSSDTIVSVLRKIACLYNKAHQNEVKHYIPGSFSDYLRRMSDMRRAESGGLPEIAALSHVLGTAIHVVDVRVQDQEEVFINTFEPARTSKGLDLGIRLLYRPGHYDLIF